MIAELVGSVDGRGSAPGVLWAGATPRLLESFCSKFAYFYFYSILMTASLRATGGEIGVGFNLLVGRLAPTTVFGQQFRVTARSAVTGTARVLAPVVTRTHFS